jgi:hypothetical protein
MSEVVAAGKKCRRRLRLGIISMRGETSKHPRRPRTWEPTTAGDDRRRLEEQSPVATINRRARGQLLRNAVAAGSRISRRPRHQA